MELKQLAQYTKLCRKLGISKLSIGDVTIEINLAFEPTSPKPKQPLKESLAEPKVEEALTDEELLYWSATGTNI